MLPGTPGAGLQVVPSLPCSLMLDGTAWRGLSVPVDHFRLFFSYTKLVFPGPESSKRVVVHCKGCGENIPAPVETMPSQPVVARCPLCHEHRRYLPSEVFLGRLSHLMIRKPVRSADGREG
jgi:hypothetical protein